MRRISSLLAMALLCGPAIAAPKKPAAVEVDPYRLDIVNKIRAELKDPYSIRDAQISTVAPGFLGVFTGTKPVACVRLNAKNSFGAYEGVRIWAFAVEGGQVTHTRKPGENLACEGRAYGPFPELGSPN